MSHNPTVAEMARTLEVLKALPTIRYWAQSAAKAGTFAHAVLSAEQVRNHIDNLMAALPDADKLLAGIEAMGWQPIETAEINVAYEVMYANANPPRYDLAVLFSDNERRAWMNCVPGWLMGMPCVLDYIDEIEQPTHFRRLATPPKDKAAV
jgi:hypothetical protein